jgi:hypothetical protein
LRKRDDNYMFYLRTAGQQGYDIGLHSDGLMWRVEHNDLSLRAQRFGIASAVKQSPQ